MSWLRYLKSYHFYFLYAIFKVHGDVSFFRTLHLFNLTEVYQSLETWKLTFNSLITGKTSYHNSTALLMRLAPISCCSSFACIYMNLPNICSESALCSSIFIAWRPPTLPHRLQWSTIGRLSLNHRVRDGNGCYPQAHRHQNSLLSFWQP